MRTWLARPKPQQLQAIACPHPPVWMGCMHSVHHPLYASPYHATIACRQHRHAPGLGRPSQHSPRNPWLKSMLTPATMPLRHATPLVPTLYQVGYTAGSDFRNSPHPGAKAAHAWSMVCQAHMHVMFSCIATPTRWGVCASVNKLHIRMRHSMRATQARSLANPQHPALEGGVPSACVDVGPPTKESPG
jgi:hypothetical protein